MILRLRTCYRLAMITTAACLVSVASVRGEARMQDADHSRSSTSVADKNIYFVGQDLGALRGHFSSNCCPKPDGVTAYLSLYSLLDDKANFGGLGLDAQLQTIVSEKGWGAGPVSAWKSVKEFRRPYLAIGLDLTEKAIPNGLTRIANGEFDAEIQHLSKFAILTEKTIFLRLGYEFDGRWNAGYDNVENYKAAWRHIVNRMRQCGASNIQFVWQSATSPIDDVLDQNHEDISRWYPGDDYVDWIGASWFVALDDIVATSSTEFRPSTARILMDELVAFARGRKKPIMIAELSPQGFDLKRRTRRNISAIWDGKAGEGLQRLSEDQIWSLWYQPFFEYLYANDDAIDAIAYINTNWDSQSMWGRPYENGYWGDSRLETAPLIARRWNKAISAWRNKSRK